MHSDLILSGVDETSNETKNLLVKPKKSGDKPRKRSDRERCAPFPLTTIYETLHDIAKHNHNLDPSKCELVARPCNLEMWYKNNRATSGAVNGFTEYKEELMLVQSPTRPIFAYPCLSLLKLLLRIQHLFFIYPWHKLISCPATTTGPSFYTLDMNYYTGATLAS